MGQIVAIGASADGIEAISRIVAVLPADFAAPVLVVQHVGRGSRGYLPQLLARAGRLPASHPHDGELIAPGRIYVAPPDHHMIVAGPRIHLTRGPEERFTRPAIDVLFRSVAVAYGPLAIGVVLTGHLDDGTQGLLAIKQHGGIAIVQDPHEAGAPSMPTSVLANVQVDHVATIAALGPLLVALVASGDRVATWTA